MSQPPIADSTMRLVCPFCGAVGWQTGLSEFAVGGLSAAGACDRLQGRRAPYEWRL